MLSGRGFIFGADLVAFFRFFRFSVLAKPTRCFAFFIHVREKFRAFHSLSSHRRELLTCNGCQDHTLYDTAANKLSLCRWVIMSTELAIQIGRRYRRRSVTLLDIFRRVSPPFHGYKLYGKVKLFLL